MTTPDRTIAQRREALERANAIRTYRAALKRDVAAGRRDYRAILTAPADEVLTMRVLDLLLAVPSVGRVKGSRVLYRAGIAPSKTVGGLSPRQRDALIRLAPGRRTGQAPATAPTTR